MLNYQRVTISLANGSYHKKMKPPGLRCPHPQPAHDGRNRAGGGGIEETWPWRMAFPWCFWGSSWDIYDGKIWEIYGKSIGKWEIYENL